MTKALVLMLTVCLIRLQTKTYSRKTEGEFISSGRWWMISDAALLKTEPSLYLQLKKNKRDTSVSISLLFFSFTVSSTSDYQVHP